MKLTTNVKTKSLSIPDNRSLLIFHMFSTFQNKNNLINKNFTL